MYALIQPKGFTLNRKPIVPRFWLIVCIVLLVCLSKIVNGQTFEEDYERRLLDIGVRYERLETAYKTLRIAHDYQDKAYTALLEEYALFRMQTKGKMQRMQEEGSAAVRIARKEGFWEGAKTGAVGVGIIITIIALIAP